MNNHIHLVIRPKYEDELPKIMQWLLGNYAKAWNKAHGVKGHLWGDRYFSKIIENIHAFLKVFDYVCKNPLKANLVKRIEDWKDSGIAHFLAQKRELLDVPICIEPIYKAYCRLLERGEAFDFNLDSFLIVCNS